MAVRPDFVFFRKTSWAKMTVLSPGPNVDRSRSGGRWPQPLVVGFRRFFFFFSGVLRVLPKKKVPFLGSKKGQQTWFSNPGPNVHQNPVRGPEMGPAGLVATTSGCRFPAFFSFFSEILRFFVKKVPFLGSKKGQKPRFSNPGPNVHRNRSGGPSPAP